MTLVLCQSFLVIISRRLDLCTILVFGSLPNHTALDLFILCVYQPWNDQFRRGLFVDLPDACIMRSSLLFRSIGRKGPYCRRPLHSHCSCSAAEAASLADADATSYCFFPPEILPEDDDVGADTSK